MGGTRGGAGASSSHGQEESSSKSSPKSSASLMYDDGLLRCSIEAQDGYAHDEPRLESDALE